MGQNHEFEAKGQFCFIFRYQLSLCFKFSSKSNGCILTNKTQIYIHLKPNHFYTNEMFYSIFGRLRRSTCTSILVRHDPCPHSAERYPHKSSSLQENKCQIRR
jgi:hypothetical protein